VSTRSSIGCPSTVACATVHDPTRDATVDLFRRLRTGPSFPLDALAKPLRPRAYRSRMSDPLHPGVPRVLRTLDTGETLLDGLASLPGSDLATLLLEVMRRRATRVSPTDLLHQYERDRFVHPAHAAFASLRAVEDAAIAATQTSFDMVTLSPVVPFAAHAVLGGISQDRLLATLRTLEVAGDATLGLALEAAAQRAAVLRHDPRSADEVHLAAAQRVVRTQQFSGPQSWAHFLLFGLVSAGRDAGSQAFEARAVVRHVDALVAIVRAFDPTRIVVRMTDFSGRHERVTSAVRDHLPADVEYEQWDEREAGRDYYPSVCFKVDGSWAGEQVEFGDGGIVDWTQRLVGSAKERLVTSGMGLDRLAAVTA
jgi:hypothetical protein